MKVTILQKEQESVVRIAGELDTIATTEQADDLQQVLNIADKALVMDCSELEFITTAGKNSPVYDTRENCNAIIETETGSRY